MKKFLIIISILLLAGYALASSDGYGVYGQAEQRLYEENGLLVLEIEWAGESDDTYHAIRTGGVEFVTRQIHGYLIGVETDPLAASNGTFDTTAGSTYVAPTDNYDIGISYNGRFIFGDTNTTSGETLSADGALANRDTANTEWVWMLRDFSSGDTEPTVELPIYGSLIFFVQNAGATNEGITRLYFKKYVD